MRPRSPSSRKQRNQLERRGLISNLSLRINLVHDPSPGALESLPIWVLLVGGFALGAIVGSFLATISIRWPRGESVLIGRSRCDSCGSLLRAYDLIPVVSFLFLRRRCRSCASPIESLHLAVEVASGAIGALSIALFPNWLGLIVAGVGWLLLLIATLDLYNFWLPDSLTLFLLLGSLALGPLGIDPAMPDRIIGAIAGFLVLWCMARIYRTVTSREGMGAGDPKLFAAIGALLGWQQLPFILLGAGMLGIAVVCSLHLAGRKMSAKTQVPLGTLLAGVAWPLWLMALIFPISRGSSGG